MYVRLLVRIRVVFLGVVYHFGAFRTPTSTSTPSFGVKFTEYTPKYSYFKCIYIYFHVKKSLIYSGNIVFCVNFMKNEN